MFERALRGFERNPVWFWLLATAVLAAGLGLRGPWPPDEPRFALIARDMLLTGDWWIPRVAGEVYADKPPAFMWAIAAMSGLTGSLRIGFLLPSLIAGLVTLWAVRDLASRLWDPRVGLVAAIALLITIQFTTRARFAQIDMLMVAFVTLGLNGLLRHLLQGPDWRAYTWGCTAMGLGMITKAVGFLPLAAGLVWLVLALRAWPGTEQLWARRWDPRWLLGPLALGAALALWLVPMLSVTATGDPELAGYRHDLLFTQTVTRYVAAWHHLKPFWYYLLQVIPVLWLPVIAALPWLVPRWRDALVARDLRIALLLGYVLLVVLFFSLSPGKRGVYVLPALPAFCLAAAPYLSEICGRLWARRTILLGMFGSLAVLGVLVAAALTGRIPQLDAASFASLAVPAWSVLGAYLVTALIWVVLLGRERVALALVGWICSAWIIFGFGMMPALDSVRSGDLVMRSASAALDEDQRLGLIGFTEQQVLQADRALTHFGYRRRDPEQQAVDGAAWLLSDPRNRLLLDAGKMHGCWDSAAVEPLVFAHRRDWYLVGAGDVTADCSARALAEPGWRERVRDYELSAPQSSD